ncbi:SDR family oxidoreductase [Massilia sp. W12]|uniref:enoyl-ACP reductase FabI n=1 Tax=Massilia sp. W12 TaxID=3126507 RepID=UPI0030CF3814
MQDPFSLAGKRGLILGLANEHSIAWGCAKVAHARGARLALSCLNPKVAGLLAPLAASCQAPLLACNVEQEDELQACIEQAAAHLGQFDFIIHSIAWAPLPDLHGRVLDCSRSGFARAMQISCQSFAETVRRAEPWLAPQASVLTMSYIGAQEATPHYGMMGPVKAALESLVRYMALELGPKGVRVHAISPGPIPTRAASGLEDFDGLMQHAITHAPLRRLATLDEIGNLAAFLVSDAASGMSGQTLFVDAGFHAVQ